MNLTRNHSWGLLMFTLGSLAGGSVGLWWGRQAAPGDSARQSRFNVTLTANQWGGTLPSVNPNPIAPPSNFIAQAVAQVEEAVVRIDTVQLTPPESRSRLQSWFNPPPSPTPSAIERGSGSGLLLGPEGQILTNAHVLEGADGVEVALHNGEVVPGQIVGLDAVTDIAAIQIEAGDWATPALGRSAAVQPGQWAIAIGNPLGLDNTITAGIVSAVGRSSSQVGVPDKRVTFIQTDAAINPGNSGGPLINDRGEVIGLNTAIRTEAQGLGFAIPIEKALAIGEQLFSQGRVDHPFVGIQMVNLTPDLRQQLQQDLETDLAIPQDQGILVVRVIAGSPAEAAGLQPGDVIERVGAVPVQTTAEVQVQVEASVVGQPLEIEVRRGTQRQTLMVIPQALATSPVAPLP
ncbi:MAG: trypsin-like peptidase domain-containing protein [Prochlorothrix sp.]|nr:trypsin-like peptidase domain-containing protein [Prochlorothrix sp.]